MKIRKHLGDIAKKLLPEPIKRPLQAKIEERRDATRAQLVRELVSGVELESPICAICGGQSVVPHTVYNGFSIVRCCNDGLIFASPRPKNTAPFYDERYYTGDMHCGYKNYASFAATYSQKWKPRLDTLQQGLERTGSLLDVGCATGVFLDQARSHGWEVGGIEISGWAVKMAQENFGLSVLQGSLPDPRVPDGFYDAVTLFDCVEHLSDPRAVLSDIRRVLKPDGLLMLSTGAVPDKDPKVVSKWYYPPWHLYYFSERTMKALLLQCGFDVVSYREEDQDVPEYTLMIVLARLTASSPTGTSEEN